MFGLSRRMAGWIRARRKRAPRQRALTPPRSPDCGYFPVTVYFAQAAAPVAPASSWSLAATIVKERR